MGQGEGPAAVGHDAGASAVGPTEGVGELGGAGVVAGGAGGGDDDGVGPVERVDALGGAEHETAGSDDRRGAVRRARDDEVVPLDPELGALEPEHLARDGELEGVGARVERGDDSVAGHGRNLSHDGISANRREGPDNGR